MPEQVKSEPGRSSAALAEVGNCVEVLDEKSPHSRGRVARNRSGFVFAGLVSILLTMLAVLAIHGSALQLAATGTEGSVGGIDYELGWPELLVLVFPVGLLGIGEFVLGPRQVEGTTKGAWRLSVLSASSAVPFFSRTFFVLFLIWIGVSDILGWWTISPGRTGQMFVDEISSGRLVDALGTTALRNTIALALATASAIGCALLVQEVRFLGDGLIPAFRLGAMIPPLFLFTFSAWFGWAIGTSGMRSAMEAMGIEHDTSIYRVVGYLDRTAVLALIAFWPLIIAAISGLSRVRQDLSVELDSLSLSRWRAITRVQLPLTVRYMSPAFYIAIVLVLVGCVHAESAAALDQPVDGVAHYYMRTAFDTGAGDIWCFGLVIIAVLGTLFLFAFDFLTALLSGLAPHS